MSSDDDIVISVQPSPEYFLQPVLRPIKNKNPNVIELRDSHKRIFIDIPNYSITINELKEIIYKKLNYIQSKFYLYYENTYLDNNKTLREYNISNTSIIYLKSDMQNAESFIIDVN